MGRPSKAEIAAREAAQAQNDATKSNSDETQVMDTTVAETTSIPTGIPAENPDIIAQMQAQIEELTKKLAAATSTPQVILAKQEEMVKLTYISNVSDDNVLDLGEFGSLTGVGWVLEIPRNDFGGKFMTPFVQKLLKKRRLIVLDGLTKEERKRYGVLYNEGEIMDTQMMDKLLDIPVDKLTTIFENLCPEHRQFVATRFITAFEKGDNRISRGKVEPLQAISKTNDSEGLFTPILKKMNSDSL